MGKLQLSIAMGDYDRTRPLYDGRVQIDGCEPTFMFLSPEEMFFRVFRHEAFDVSEISISSYCVKLAQNVSTYIAIPVFLSRAFRHTSIYIRNDKDIKKPEDLRGKRIGIAEYQLSANVWVRGILEDDYGVKPSEVTWVRGGMNTGKRPEKISLSLPDEITIKAAPQGKSLNTLLTTGEIDGYIGPRSPQCFDEGHPKISRLFSESIEVAADYYSRTNIFPVMHLLGVRRSLADQHPWLPGALLKAFSISKSIAQEALQDTSATKVTMPFVEDTLSNSKKIIGLDYWSYGLPGNEIVLDKFLEYHYRQGLSKKRLSVEELFHPATHESYSL